jgi:hypothetical protein
VTTTDKDFVVKNGLIVQGAQGTIDGSVIVTEAALNTSLGDYVALTEKGSADGVAELDANQNVLTKTAVVFEGTTVNTSQTTLDVVDPTADRTITLPNVSGTVVTTGNQNDAYPSQSGQTGKYLKTNGTTVEWAAVSGGGTLETLTIGTGLSGTSYNGSSAVTIAIDSSVATTSGSQTLTNKTISGTSNTITNVANTSLTNSSVTINGTSISLGGTQTITAVNPNSLTIGSGLSGTSYNGSASVTIAIDSTVATTSGSQTLTNKTLTSPVISTITNTGTLTLPTSTDTLVGRATTDTLTNKTLGALNALGADLSAATYKITNLGTPSASTDAATKQYVDDLAQGLHVHASCVAATTSNLNANYSNGTDGVGATLTNAGALVAFSVDGVSPTQGSRILVKNQSTTFQNGIYTLSTVGSTSVAWVLTRALDFNEPVEIDGGDFTFVTGGTAGDNTGWVQTETITTIGSDAILFTQFSGAGTYLAGNGLTLTSNTFSINTSITADTSTAQTLTNKTISGANNTLTVRLANDISGFGTGIATALAVNTGTAGSIVVNGGALGTPSSGTLTNATGLPVTSGISGMGTGIATFLATPSSANLASAITDETGSGLLVFGTSPTISLPAINNILYGYTTTATAAGTTTLTASSNYKQYFTGSTTQTVVLPVASTMTLGQTFYIENNSTGNLTVNSSGGNLVVTVIPGSVVLITCILTSGTTAASWDVDWDGFTTITGTGSNVLATAPTISNLVLSGTLNAGGGNGTSGQVLSSTGTGVQWTTPASGGSALSEFLLMGG